MEAEKPCRKCGVKLAETNSSPSQWKYRIFICRDCDREQHAKLREKNREHFRNKMCQWKEENREKVLASSAAYRERHREELRERGKIYYQANIDRASNVRKLWSAALKVEVMSAYSKGKPNCSSCNYADIRALTIDHIKGGGTKHRKELKGGGVRMYQWLKAQNYPDGYQVLCMNCQFIKKHENNEHRLRLVS